MMVLVFFKEQRTREIAIPVSSGRTPHLEDFIPIWEHPACLQDIFKQEHVRGLPEWERV